MPIGIASPTPSGLPGFNLAYGIVAHVGGLAAAATPLPSWLNVVTGSSTDTDSVMLPPGYPGAAITVINQAPHGVAVYGYVNPSGVVDVQVATGATTTSVSSTLASSGAAMWICMIPEAGQTNAPTGAVWKRVAFG